MKVIFFYPFVILVSCFPLTPCEPDTSSLGHYLTKRLIDLQGGPDAFVWDESGLLYPKNQAAVTWLKEYRLTGKWKYINQSVDSNSPLVPRSVKDDHSGSPHEICGVHHRRGKKKEETKNLLIVPVGDAWRADFWLDRPEDAIFDIIAIYYGDNPDEFRCPLCAKVYNMKGPKWRLYYLYTSSPEWPAIATQYEYIMLPDDDLGMDTCTINAVFELMRRYDVLLGQPSVCEADQPGTWRPELHQRIQYELRFTTFVEVMAPVFRMDFFDQVVKHTFSKYWTYVGWGLDWIWPALLAYPKTRIAVIDLVCMRHIPSEGGLGAGVKPDSVYRPGLSPFKPKQEETIMFRSFNYTQETANALGEVFMSSRILGGILNRRVANAMSESLGVEWPPEGHPLRNFAGIKPVADFGSSHWSTRSMEIETKAVEKLFGWLVVCCAFLFLMLRLLSHRSLRLRRNSSVRGRAHRFGLLKVKIPNDEVN